MVNERDALSYIQLLKRRIFKERHVEHDTSDSFTSHSVSEAISDVPDPAATTNYLASEDPALETVEDPRLNKRQSLLDAL